MVNIQFQGLTKSYDGEMSVVDKVDLDVEEGEFVVLVGPSGCGKSTTLRMIAGLEEISDGTIAFNGQVINDLTPRERNIAMVFQSYALYPHKTVYENIAFNLRKKKMDKKKIDQLVHETASSLGLEELLKRKPRHLSGGQRQRVALARAIVREPNVFLFDEPLSNLDANLRTSTRVEIAKLHQRLKKTMIYVTHDQVEAMTLATRVAVMNKGKVAQFDTPIHIYESPNNLFVAGFMGSPKMNFLTKKILKNQEGYFILMNGNPIQLKGARFEKLDQYLDQVVIIGIRPEHFTQAAGGEADIVGQIDMFEYQGKEKIIYSTVDEEEIIIRLKVDKNFHIGDHIGFKIELDNIHIFNPETEEAITKKLAF